MTLAANALTTVAAAKDELGIAALDTSQDTYLETLINRSSSAIERFCNRSFYRDAATVENLEGYGGMKLVVSRTPIVSITSIAYNGAALDAATYEIHDADAGIIRFLGPILWTTVVLPNIKRDAYPGEERKLYRVTYAGGYTIPSGGAYTLPEDLVEACLLAVVDRFRRKGRDPSVQSERLMSYSVSYANDPETLETGLPPAVRGLLAPWRRVALA